MPLYEEKLINPLAVRFSQEHIRTTFRDGRIVEPTVEEIETQPGVGDYDVVLKAPFPHIEIIRWRPPSFGGSSDADVEVDAATDDGKHWFTLDNRRLYCLQKAAVALLPKRAAAVVEILYADDGHVWRKYDTETQGVSVSISHSTKSAPTSHWSWGDAVGSQFLGAAKEAMQVDDLKTTVDELRDASAGAEADPASIVARLSDALLRAEAHEAACSAKAHRTSSCPTPSTTYDSSDELGEAKSRGTRADGTEEAHMGSDGSPASSAGGKVQRGTVAALTACLEGVKWISHKGETYEVSRAGEARWTCHRRDKGSTKIFTLSYDADHALVYWGLDMAYYFDASEIGKDSDEVRWYAYSDWEKKKARFTWKLSEPRQSTNSEVEEASTPPAWPPDPLAVNAMVEIKEIMAAPGFDGRVRMPHWSFYYFRLGSLRTFLERWPQHFAVTALDGCHFTVADAAESARPDAPKWKTSYSSGYGNHYHSSGYSDARWGKRWTAQ